MQRSVLEAVVSGKNCEGKNFQDFLIFTLLPPKETEYYGTGCYMRVEQSNPEFKEKYFVDARYEQTKDIEVLADRWIINFYGENAEKIKKNIVEGENS